MTFHMEPRKRLSPSQKASIRTRQNNLCAECGQILEGAIEFDHVTPLSLGGTNAVENFEALHAKPCHQGRTRKSAGIRAKADRQAQRTGQQARRAEGKAQGFSTWLNMRGERRTKRRPEA